MHETIIDRIRQTEHGFKHIIETGDKILTNQDIQHVDLAIQYLADDSYQVRMLAVYLLGKLSPTHPKALSILESRVADDPNWRVQEMLAKAFDYYCTSRGYEETFLS
ncbi:HEAT repeat domain-containing protein [uncultured Chryseobacterium sp.]|uniref:HEAT repeat domain-containing protein n=1 Tax=uncultured Chryseobacterium sp. TaxID=259322 RepID=UPI0025E98E71|nr:HEAT repeat domain-containing protein [uncultured Chryseobacterium sp.]